MKQAEDICNGLGRHLILMAPVKMNGSSQHPLFAHSCRNFPSNKPVCFVL
jgi:hypothetical protein